MCFGTQTNIFINGVKVNGCCGGFPPPPMPCMTSFSPGCFGFGYAPMCGNSFGFGAGLGLGYAAGATLVPAMPTIFSGIGKGCSWLWNNALKPAFKGIGTAASFVWNKGIKPAAVGVWNGIKAAGSWIGNGVKNIWNKIFHRD